MNVKLFSLLTVACAANVATADASAQKPNVIVFLADDMGWGDVSYHGFSDIRTPNIDALAATGCTFSQGYVSASVSGPSRAGLMTGCYQQRFGFYGNSSKCVVPSERLTIAERLKNKGYSTGMVGKWHLGETDDQAPESRGFDSFYGMRNGSHDYYRSTTDVNCSNYDLRPIYRNSEIQPPFEQTGEYMTERLTNEAMDFLDKQTAEQPFFLYVAYNAVHYPWQVPDKYVERLNDMNVHHPDRRVFAAMALAMDDGIGQIMNMVREKGMEDNTLVFFLCDNGSPRGQGIQSPENDTMKDRGGAVMSSPAHFRGWKGDTYEGGIRVPFLINWKGHVRQGEYSNPVISLDIAATALAVAGASESELNSLDGVNLLPYVNGEVSSDVLPHEVMYWRRDDDFAIRKGDWKLAYNDEGSTRRIQLFNLKDDEGEYHDLSDEYPEIAQSLRNEFDAWDSQLPDYPYRANPANRNSKYVEGHIESVVDYNRTVSFYEQSQDFVIFHESLSTADIYEPSWWAASNGSEMPDMPKLKFILSKEMAKEGNQALKMNWISRPGGVWNACVASEYPQKWGTFSVYASEAIHFWIATDAEMSAGALPLVKIQDIGNRVSAGLPMKNYVDVETLSPNQWVEVVIPMEDFICPANFDKNKVKSLYFSQGTADNVRHSLYLDEIVVTKKTFYSVPLFDDSASDEFYDESVIFQTLPSLFVEHPQHPQKLPVTADVAEEGNALYLDWTSFEGGDWSVLVAGRGWPKYDITEMDVMKMSVFSTETLEADLLPSIFFESHTGKKTGKLALNMYVKSIPANQWVEIDVDLDLFRERWPEFQFDNTKGVFFCQHVADGKNHKMYVDNILFEKRDGTSSVGRNENCEEFAVKYSNGIVSLSENVNHLQVFDISGMCLFAKSNVEKELNMKLHSGVYIFMTEHGSRKLLIH